MFKSLKMTMLFCLMVLLAGGCASVQTQGKTTEILKPSGVHEDCMELRPGETLDYFFEASGPLDFNIHCHEDNDIIYAVSRDACRTDRGKYLCEKQQYYCLMWTNPGPKPATLQYEWRVIKKRE
ncbi:MAG TPA: hypothetical protein VN328_08740 [Thermodesulfovibrionales bacterium]|nr:hypothetical protein [Thermodesulfovibrionales bacterium]